MPPKKVSLPPNPPPDPSQNIPFQYTTFFSVAPLNAKNVASSYLKTEAQTWISRAQANQPNVPSLFSTKRRKRNKDGEDANGAGASSSAAAGAGIGDSSMMLDDDDDDVLDGEDDDAQPAENTPAHRTIVIHPGSENIRIGRATDLFPITVPNAIARRAKLHSEVMTPPLPPQQTDDALPSASTLEQKKEKVDGDADVEMGDAQNEALAKESDAADVDAQDSRPARRQPRRSATNGSTATKDDAASDADADGDEAAEKKAALDEGVEKIRNDLRAIMRQEKLRSVGNAKNLAANYNDSSQPEDVPEHNDLFGLEWIDEDAGGEKDILFGEQALRLACFSQPKTDEPDAQQRRQQQASGIKPLSPPDKSRPWKLFRPFKRGTLDLNAYEEHFGASSAVQALLGDVRRLLEHAIVSPPEDSDRRQETGKVEPRGLGIPKDDFHLYTVVLIIPDLFSRADVKALAEVLMVDMGFAQTCVQQESVSATFGAGLSSACVIDLGAELISISCVEEGLILPETRIQLSYAGNDLTRFLAELFIRAKFPYRELEYKSNVADFMLVDEIKRKLVTLNPSDIGLNIHDFYLRLPSRPTMKYLFRTYDELIMGPMSLFDPAVYDLDSKALLKGKFRAGYIEDNGADEAVDEEAPELSVYNGLDVPVTGAMTSCVKHLLPPPAPAQTPAAAAAQSAANGASGTGVPGSEVGTPAPQTAGAAADVKSKLSVDAATESAMASRAGTPGLAPASNADGSMLPSADASARPSPSPQNGAGAPPGAGVASGGGGGGGGVGGGASAGGGGDPNGSGFGSGSGSASAAAPLVVEPPKPTIDIHFEASKTALDTAVFNSLLASIGQVGPAGDERLRKMSNNILCVGGTALIPGLGAALQARLTALLDHHFQITTGDPNNAPKVTVIPPPRDMDPQLLTWKGMSVFARLDAVTQELCLRRDDWLLFGYRALKEKTLFL
ncbi:actin-like ATPase domain-containing protein [Testicularia cyperi]|uniref:Actin-like ATPase domain-containing protein n=1 Tax=Testicularia cyperi TaxID=1882483 RepID=A0A317XIH0_9BASI|nr:actin-like ATPase domain-containing protein [Testicularia cyperi]